METLCRASIALCLSLAIMFLIVGTAAVEAKAAPPVEWKTKTITIGIGEPADSGREMLQNNLIIL